MNYLSFKYIKSYYKTGYRNGIYYLDGIYYTLKQQKIENMYDLTLNFKGVQNFKKKIYQWNFNSINGAPVKLNRYIQLFSRKFESNQANYIYHST